MTKHAAVMLTLPVLFGSCATIFNGPVQPVHIATSPAIREVWVGSSILVDSTSKRGETVKTYIIFRSKQALAVHLQLDTGTKTVLLRAQNSFAYFFNIPGNYGVGMLVDKHNAHRYGYPGWNYFSLKDSTVQHHRFAPVPGGTVRLSLVLPFINGFSMPSPEGRYQSGGALALELGLDYFYKENRYLSFTTGAATDGGAEHIGRGYFRNSSTRYAALRNNYVAGSFDLGYGLSISGLRWRQVANGDSIKTDKSAGNTAIGLSLSAQYRFGRYFRMGVLYQPGIVSTGASPAWNYQHYMSLYLAWKLPFNGPKHK